MTWKDGFEGGESPFLHEAFEGLGETPGAPELLRRIEAVSRGLSPAARRQLQRALARHLAVTGARRRARRAAVASPLRRALKEAGATDLEALEALETELGGADEAAVDETLEEGFLGFYLPVKAPRSTTLPLVLAGPIVRRAESDGVWFWFACSEEVTGCTPQLTIYDSKGVVNDLLTRDGFYPLAAPELRVARLGEHLWIVMVAARPKSRPFPPGWIYGYDLEIEYRVGSVKSTTKLSSQGLAITYRPFALPTFLMSSGFQRLAQGSCRRPGSTGRDAFPAFDDWLGTQITDVAKRPSSLLLTGDQIYADDVAIPLFKAVHKLARDVFGYTERLPREGGALVSVDEYELPPTPGAGAGSRAPQPRTRKALTSLGQSPIGFTTDDGEAHLLSFPEYASMYLAVWNEQLCKSYGVEDGSDASLKGFPAAVAASRRVLANTVTYMGFDDHEITDDWNLDADWEKATKNPMAQRIIANGLAAYWAFQGWGNDPSLFDAPFVDAVTRHLDAMRQAKGYPGDAAKAFDKTLLERHWSFVAATAPPALFVDTRTRRETPPGQTAVLSGPRVWPYLTKLAERHQLKKGEFLLIVLPTPLLPHRGMMWAQQYKYDWPRNRYSGEFELYANNPRQRADLISFLHGLLAPPALVIFSGDVHHGSVIDGLYVHGKSRDAIDRGDGDWGMRVAQVTSSPIKNIKTSVYEEGHWYLGGTDQGNAGESLVPQVENQYATMPDGTAIGMRAESKKLAGPLGRQTFIFENHLCVVDVPQTSIGGVSILFVGVKDGALATATTWMPTDNKPSSYRPPLQMWPPYIRKELDDDVRRGRQEA